MLMVLCKHSITDNISIVARLVSVDADNIEDTRCASFDCYCSRQIKLVSKDIFVICQCDNELDNTKQTRQ